MRSISIDRNEIQETNNSESLNKTKLDSPIISKFKNRNFNIDSNPIKISQDISNNHINNNEMLKVTSRTMMSNLNNFEMDKSNNENFALFNKTNKNKNPLLFDSEEFIHKYDLVNIIPKTSFLKVDDKKFISRGEVQKIIDSKKNSRNDKISLDQKLTPFQKNENYKNLLKEKLKLNKEINGDKGILMRKSYENFKNINLEELNLPSSSCTIFSYDKNSNKNCKDIIFSKIRNDNSVLDLANTSKEYLPNIGYQSMSTTGFGILINFNFYKK